MFYLENSKKNHYIRKNFKLHKSNTKSTMKITVEEKNFLCSYTIADAHGEFEMADADVETLVALIREKKTTDINKLGINESHPAIYELLREEINSIRYYSACDHDMREGIFNAECEWDIDTDELIDYCRQNCGLKNSEFYEIYEEYFDSDDDDDEDDFDEENDDDFDFDDDDDEDDFDDEAYVEVHKKRGEDFYDCFWTWYRHYVDTAPYEDIDELFHALYDPDYECDFDFGYDTDPFIPQQIIEMAGIEEEYEEDEEDEEDEDNNNKE